MKGRFSVNSHSSKGSHSGKGNGGLYGGWHPTNQSPCTEALKDRLEKGCSFGGRKSVGYLAISKKAKARLLEMGILTIPYLKETPRSELVSLIWKSTVLKLEEIFAFQEGRHFEFKN